eukprot:7442737-Heterocapsa_arctica.AAC.1
MIASPPWASSSLRRCLNFMSSSGSSPGDYLGCLVGLIIASQCSQVNPLAMACSPVLMCAGINSTGGTHAVCSLRHRSPSRPSRS